MTVRLSRRLVSILLARIEVGCLVVVEGGERRVYGSGAPSAIVRIDSPQTSGECCCAAAVGWQRPLPSGCGTRQTSSR